MAYTPYNQALPDTVLYERLQGSYTPIRGRENPYDVSLFNTDYYKDPFGYTKKKLGFGPTLDETLGNKAAAVGLGGLFTPQQQGYSAGGDSASQENQRNYYQEIEDRFYNENLAMGLEETTARTLAEQERFGIQSKNNQALVDNLLNPLSSLGIAGLFSKIIGGTPTPAGTGTRAPVVTASDTIAGATREAEARAVAERQAAAQAEAAQAAADAARNVQPIATYTPTGIASDASDWSPKDSSGNISWSGQTYSPSAYSSLSDAFG